MYLLHFFLFLLLSWGVMGQSSSPEKVFEFKGHQPSGLALSEKGRIFVAFPKWREETRFSLVEVVGDRFRPYPDANWNSWQVGFKPTERGFMAVQAVVTQGNYLYVLDTAHPLWLGVNDAPRVYVFSLVTNKLHTTYFLSDGSYNDLSYFTNMVVDDKNKVIYLTDGSEPALVVLDMNRRASRRVLTGHASIKDIQKQVQAGEHFYRPQTKYAWAMTYHQKKDMVLYQSLFSNKLYGVSAKALREGTAKQIEESVAEIYTGTPSHAFYLHKKELLYFSSILGLSINTLSLSSKAVQEHTKGVGLVSSFAYHKGYLYFIASDFHIQANQIPQHTFPIYRIKVK